MPLLFGVRLDDISDDQLEEKLCGWLDADTVRTVFTPNPEFILSARKDDVFLRLLNTSDLSLPDGIGLRFALAALDGNTKLRRHTGIDTLELLAKLCEKKHKRLVLFGAEQNIAQDAADALKKKYVDFDVVAISPGYISGDSTDIEVPREVWDEVRQAKPDVIAVALGQGKQERFCADAKVSIPTVKIAIGIGGAFDILSGQLARAPSWMRQKGIEWAWRLFIEPARYKRIIRATILFPVVVVWETVRNRRLLKATAMVARAILSNFKMN